MKVISMLLAVIMFWCAMCTSTFADDLIDPVHLQSVTGDGSHDNRNDPLMCTDPEHCHDYDADNMINTIICTNLDPEHDHSLCGVLETDPVTNPDDNADSIADPDQATDSDPVTDPDPAADSDPVTDPDQAADSDPVTDPDPAADSDPVTDPDPSADSDPVTDIDIDDNLDPAMIQKPDSKVTQGVSISLLSIGFEPDEGSRLLNVNVDPIIRGKSFKISWESVSGADHYEVAINRFYGNPEQNSLIHSNSRIKVDLGTTSYRVSASDVPSDTNRFRIFVCAAYGSDFPCSDSNILKSSTMTITARSDESQEMDVSISVDDDGARVSWDRVDGVSYYIYSALNTDTGNYIAKQVTTNSRYFDIDSSSLIYNNKYKIWVCARDSNGKDIAQHLVDEIILRKECRNHIAREVISAETYPENARTKTHHDMLIEYEMVCKYCETPMSGSRTETITQEHEYSHTGKCVCGYVGGECSHINKGEDNSRTIYECEDKNKHTRIEIYDIVCEDCDTVLEKNHTESTYGLSHSFRNDVCRNCSYKRASKLTLTLQRGMSAAKPGDTMTASVSIAGGTGVYSIVWNVYLGSTCFESDLTGAYISGDSKSASYKADQAGDWYFEAVVSDSDGETVSGKTEAIIVNAPACQHKYETVDRPDLTEYDNANDFQHLVKYHYDSTCSLCNDVANSWISEELKPHVFNAQGVCICGEIKEPDPQCTHDWSSTLVDTVIEQTQLDDSMAKHRVIFKYSDECIKCSGKSSHETEIYEAHVFNKNGECVCGYVQVTPVCDHATTGAVEGSPTYTDLNSNEHSITIFMRHKCSCGQVDELRETVTRTAHVYVNGVCVCGRSDTGSVCPHTSTIDVWDIGIPLSYLSISDTQHSVTGYVLEKCEACSEIVVTNHPDTKFYSHVFDSLGDCTQCDFRATCKHDVHTSKAEGTVYTSISSKKHSVASLFSKICANSACQVVIIPFDVSLTKTYEEDHVLVGGVCTLCSYVYATTLTVTVSAGQSQAYVGETIYAKAKVSGGAGGYKYCWTVYRDGVVEYQTDWSMGDTYNYTTSKDGTYVFTVTVEDSAGDICSASTAAITALMPHTYIAVKKTHLEQIANDDKNHTLITTVYDECTECGDKSPEIVTRMTVPHKFNYTGYEEKHPHQQFKRCACKYAVLIDNSYHTANGAVQEEADCCICNGHEISATPFQDDGVWVKQCLRCGLLVPYGNGCKHDSVDDLYSWTVEASHSYTNYNDIYYHMKYFINNGFTKCELCGEVFEEKAAVNGSIQELHKFDDDGVCKLCEYVSLNGLYSPEDRYSAVVVPAEYYSDGYYYIGVGKDVSIFITDKSDGKQYLIDQTDVELTVNDPYDIATRHINGYTFTVNRSGSFVIKLSYLGKTFASIGFSGTFLDVTDNFIYYSSNCSDTITLQEMLTIDWSDCNVMLTPKISIGDFSAVSNNNGDMKISFNAYNCVPSVFGIGVYDADGNLVDLNLINGYWASGSFLDGLYETVVSTPRVFDGKSYNETSTALTNVSITVPIGGTIRVLKASDNIDVFAANAANLVLGVLKTKDAVEGLINPTDLDILQKCVDPTRNNWLNSKQYKSFLGYLKTCFGETLKDISGFISEEADEATTKAFLGVFADNWSGLLNAFDEFLQDTALNIGKSAIDKAEDAALYSANPFLYFNKQSIDGVIGVTGIGYIYNVLVSCFGGEDLTLIDQIVMPARKQSTLLLPSVSRYIVTNNSCILRDSIGQTHSGLFEIPADTRAELIGSYSDNEGLKYYELVYNGRKGFILTSDAELENLNTLSDY